MERIDRRGNPCGSASAAARDAVEKGLWQMMSFYDTPLADLDAARAADPGWALPYVMHAGFLLSLTEASMQAEAAVQLQRARERAGDAPPRERAHLEAVERLLEGRWTSACRIWDEVLIAHPRDALALQWGQLWDFYRGDVPSLRQRPARALPEWDEDDPLHAYVLSLYAFGLEENNLHAQAEDIGRRALAANPRAPWAVHAVAHVMEMQGRYEEGAGWLRQYQEHWVENGFAAHLWWHKGLFRLEGLDLTGALRLIDKRLSGDALQLTVQRVDAAALLWRLHLLGSDVSALCQSLLAGWDLSDTAAGYYAFNDVHAVLAMLGAGDVARAEAWVARCAERAMAPEDARRSNHLVAREAGLPLLRGLLAYARGEHDAAAEALFAARIEAQRFGGSHAQRDFVDQTLLSAAALGSRRDIGRALLNERLLAKPVTPLTEHWRERLAVSTDQRA